MAMQSTPAVSARTAGRGTPRGRTGPKRATRRFGIRRPAAFAGALAIAPTGSIAGVCLSPSAPLEAARDALAQCFEFTVIVTVLLVVWAFALSVARTVRTCVPDGTFRHVKE